MPITETTAGKMQAAAYSAMLVGVAANGRFSATPFNTRLSDHAPVFFSECRKRGQNKRLVSGSYWVWREGAPWIVALVIQETPHGIIRPRFVEAALSELVTNWVLEGLSSAIFIRPADDFLWQTIDSIVALYLSPLAHPIVIAREDAVTFDPHPPA